MQIEGRSELEGKEGHLESQKGPGISQIRYRVIWFENSTFVNNSLQCTMVFSATPFTIAKTWKQLKCPSADEWIKKMGCIY
ncbi:hypothetical protein PSZ95_24755, partial [Shigella sonnei]|nr:hypothetical protein [Shigella sonnei]